MRAEARRRAALLLLSAVLGGTGVLLTLSVDADGLAKVSPGLNWYVLLALFAFAEVAVVNLPHGRETLALSFAEIPLVFGLMLAQITPNELAVARVLGALLPLLVLWRFDLVKVAANVAQWTFHVGTALALYVLFLGSADPLSPHGWLAVLGAVVAADIAVGLALQASIVLRSGTFDGHEVVDNLGSGVAVAGVNSIIGLVSVLVLHEDARTAFLLLLVAVIVFLVYRGYQLLRLRHGRLEQLYRFTKAVDTSMRDSTVADTIVEEARVLMRAQDVAVVLDVDGQVQSLAGSAELAGQTWWHPTLSGSVLRLPRRRPGEPSRQLTGTGYLDGLAVPLRGERGLTGALVVAGRLDAVTTFDHDDLKLLESLAGHAGIALDNDRLVEAVRAEAAAKEYMALHDQLTSLPNRLSYHQQLDEVLGAGGQAAVVLMDVDRFKEVNDTLGHDVGDMLLVELAARLRSLVREDRMVARLGGDEFAVLLTGEGDEVATEAEALARELLTAVSVAFRVGNLNVQVRTSVGIAVAPEDGTNATLLLRHAEIAMYEAKGGVSSVSRYTAARDSHSPRRLSLAADLELALSRRTLEVVYQPQVDVASGRVLGVEALVRWKHPRWGVVSPDEFVPVAERTGLINPLTQFVLDTALQQCAQWRQRGLLDTASVNVSMRNLLEPDLAEHVGRLQRSVGLPGDALVVEITESEIMAEPERSISMLHRISGLGVAVAVDDFGTGHSSLLYLRSLPVDEVKVDREFTRNIQASADDAAIVRSVIELAHQLHIRVVAEGVEDAATLRSLRGWGCDLAQGYFVARPMSVPDADRWLVERASATV